MALIQERGAFLGLLFYRVTLGKSPLLWASSSISYRGVWSASLSYPLYLKNFNSVDQLRTLHG